MRQLYDREEVLLNDALRRLKLTVAISDYYGVPNEEYFCSV